MLKLEFNDNYISNNQKEGIIGVVGNSNVAITPFAIGREDYWIFKVQLTENQALIAFPKFFTYGIGFMNETDWNTNLPYICEAEEIYSHIEHNKGDEEISQEDCITAIKLLKKACEELNKED